MPARSDIPLEIERVFLLARMPDLAAGAIALRIEQGYLPDQEVEEAGDPSEVIEGRLRRTVRPDGSVVCVHTVKKGTGMVRTEIEKTIDESEFDALWGRTVGRRISKTRHKVRTGELTWEIDDFDDLDLVMAEVELPSAETEVDLPDWLAPLVVRELTEEPAYRNYSLATEGLPEGHPSP